MHVSASDDPPPPITDGELHERMLVRERARCARNWPEADRLRACRLRPARLGAFLALPFRRFVCL